MLCVCCCICVQIISWCAVVDIHLSFTLYIFHFSFCLYFAFQSTEMQNTQSTRSSLLSSSWSSITFHHYTNIFITPFTMELLVYSLSKCSVIWMSSNIMIPEFHWSLKPIPVCLLCFDFAIFNAIWFWLIDDDIIIFRVMEHYRTALWI